MAGHLSSIAPRASALRAIMVLSIISIWFSAGPPRVVAGSPDELSANRLKAKLVTMPLSFEPNRGQAASAVQFLSRGTGYALFLAPGEVTLDLQRPPASPTEIGQTRTASVDRLRMSLIAANANAGAAGLAPQPGIVNYFIGADPKRWRTGIRTYGKVNYSQVYPGVDLVFYGNQRQLEYDFVVAPGADPSRIAWRIDGARARLDAAGNLILHSRHGQANFRKPVLYQMDGTKRVAVDGAFAVRRNKVRFRIDSYDHSRALIIDPVLSYVTYLAGTGSDQVSQITGPGILQNGSGQGIAIDAAGSAYVTGRTTSVDLPAKNGYQMVQSKGGAPSAFVTKFSPDGSSLVYSTYLGGSNWDYAFAIAVDSSGSAYVTGLAQSPDFPITKGAYQTVCSPQPSNKVTSANDSQSGCYGSTPSVFVTKLSPAGNSLVYSTFLGGFGGSYGTGIAVDSADRAYVAGNENNPCNTSYVFQACFPTTAGATVSASGANNVTNFCFAAVFDSAGANLLYSTLFGDLNGVKTTRSAGETMATGITVDSSGNFYLIGNTKAGKLPTIQGAVQPSGTPLDVTGTYLTAYRGFIAKFSPVTPGASLAACTYLGGKTGNSSDYLSGIAIDNSGNIYVVGYTNSTDFPVTTGAYNTVCGPGGGTCAAGHVTKLNPSLSSIVWSTYVGGSMQGGGDSLFFTGPIQLDGKGNVYITGQANPKFPLLNSVEPTMCCSGGQVVVELDPTGSNLLFSTSIGSAGIDSMQTGGLAVDSAGNIYVAGNNLGADLITTPGAFQTTNPSPIPTCCYHAFVAKITPSVGPLITVAGATPAVFNAATFQTGGIAPNEFISLFGTGLGPATGVSGLATQLAGSSVSINGTAAYLTYAQDGQINVLVPFRVSGLSNTAIQVTYLGVVGNSVSVPVAASSPGIFTQSYGPGQAWVVNQDNTFNSSSNPAARNSYIAFWATGQGLVNTSLQDGAQPTSPWPTPMLPVSVSVGGVPVPAANIVFDGLIFTGEIQMNIQIPANVPTGAAVPLVVTIGGVSSRSDATIAIR
jgi:uncharacterized protein (TIGR03437 family)